MKEEKELDLLGRTLEPTHVGMDLNSLPSGEIRFTMRNDFMFKAVLQKNLYVLKGLLCALLDLMDEQIVAIEILNPIELGKTVTDKTCVLDIKIKLNNNTILNLEMQVSDKGNWRERSLTYLCRAFDHLQQGEDYKYVRDTIHIGILDYYLTGLTPELYAKYKMMNVANHEIYSGKLDLRVLNLKHLDRMSEEEKAKYPEELLTWIQFFKAKTWEDVKMLAQSNAHINEAMFTIHEMTEEERIREECEAREKFNWDWASSMEKSWNEGHEAGFEIGLEAGREAGHEEGQQITLVKLICKKHLRGLSISAAADMLEIEESLVQQIYTIADDFAPDYDVEQIYEKYKNIESK